MHLTKTSEDFFFHKFELGSHNSDARAIYTTLNMNIEKVSKFVGFLFTKCGIAGFLPLSVLLTLVNYFAYDFGAESYYLASPMWYVLGVLDQVRNFESSPIST